MPPEVVERIFEPFYTTKGERGTGLGLAASHGIVARHNGQIMVVSLPGEGTRFEVRLPLFEEARRAKQESAAGPHPIQAEPARLLVVEDEERVRSLLCDTFEAAGHTVIQASDGAAALRHLEEEDFELVISDIGLPEVSGLQVARWIKTNRPGLPVILATGWIDMITPADYEQGRIDAVFKKPYAVKEVLDRANELLKAARDEKSGRELLRQ